MARKTPIGRSVGRSTTQLTQGYKESGMIQPGAHPEREKETGFGNPIKQIGKAIKAAMAYDPYKKKK